MISQLVLVMAWCCQATSHCLTQCWPGACPTNGISIEFKIQWNYVMLSFINVHSTYHNKILHTSQQLHCRGVCRIPLWLVECILNQSTTYLVRIRISIQILLVGQAPYLCPYGITRPQWVKGHLHQRRPRCGAWVPHAGSAMNQFIGIV